jgi:hypothetical protein
MKRRAVSISMVSIAAYCKTLAATKKMCRLDSGQSACARGAPRIPVWQPAYGSAPRADLQGRLELSQKTPNPAIVVRLKTRKNTVMPL